MADQRRRELLALTAAAVVAVPAARAALVKGGPPWTPTDAAPPPQEGGPGWRYFTDGEGAIVEAMVDRFIPPDPETPGGKDCGCAVFIDRQLAGSYGRADDIYAGGPFQHGTKEQGDQSSLTPAAQYRVGLAALDQYCKAQFSGAGFSRLAGDKQDTVLKGLEDGSVMLRGVDSKTFFHDMLIDTQQGFFADPVYGGNRDMASWKMIGFPGARYDYRDWVHRHNERYPLPPISIREHPNWKG
ncbi:MAG TPA: gluconate 2-dehydrogenase subunit 3 family protein [Acetobacteraceae bacterium]|nr:gluconate 2-dehydrogenase subunit 3 family protein [Acetobacteraceae bacterium]